MIVSRSCLSIRADKPQDLPAPGKRAMLNVEPCKTPMFNIIMSDITDIKKPITLFHDMRVGCLTYILLNSIQRCKGSVPKISII